MLMYVLQQYLAAIRTTAILLQAIVGSVSYMPTFSSETLIVIVFHCRHPKLLQLLQQLQQVLLRRLYFDLHDHLNERLLYQHKAYEEGVVQPH